MLQFDSIIIGAGISGLYQLHKCRDELNLKTLAIEEGSDIGGTQKGVLKVTLAASTSPDAAWQLIDDEDDAMAGGAADDDEEDVGDEAEVVLVGYCC